MKAKIIAALLAVVLVGTSAFLFSSCGNKDNTNSNKSEEQTEKFEWPDDSELAALLPDPEAEAGEVTYDSSNSFDVDIKNYTAQQFKAYIKKCKENGFKVDYTFWEDYFSAKNKEGYSLSIDYDKDKKVMDISIYAPSDDDDEDETEATTKKVTKSSKTKSSKAKSSKASSKAKTDTSADFKKTMDEYEKFMDEYVDFMKKYNKSDNALEMLSDYSDMMDKYNEFAKKIDDIDEDSLSTDDYAYYLEVTNRVNKKLLEVAS